jgi:tetratricopeptide (TPR) repeat protein
MKLLWIALLLGCSAGHYADKGKSALDQHQLAKAEAQFRKALSRDPDHVDALSGLGWTYLLAGQTEAAKGSFERCATVSDRNPDCFRGLAGVASSLGNPREARRLLNEGLLIDEYHAGIQSSLALLELVSGETDVATRRYESLIQRFPSKAEYRLGLAEVRIRQDRHMDALDVIEQALTLSDTPARTRAILFQTQARALVSVTADRVNEDQCADTAPQVRIWLDVAKNSVEQARQTGVPLPDIHVVRRLIKRQRARVNEKCPKQEKSSE